MFAGLFTVFYFVYGFISFNLFHSSEGGIVLYHMSFYRAYDYVLHGFKEGLGFGQKFGPD